MNRRAPGEPPDVEPLLAHEALTISEALVAYTTGSAWVNRLGDQTGRLEVGFRADVVAVDADLLAADTASIGATTVTRTWAGGREVHRG